MKPPASTRAGFRYDRNRNRYRNRLPHSFRFRFGFGFGFGLSEFSLGRERLSGRRMVSRARPLLQEAPRVHRYRTLSASRSTLKLPYPEIASVLSFHFAAAITMWTWIPSTSPSVGAGCSMSGRRMVRGQGRCYKGGQSDFWRLSKFGKHPIFLRPGAASFRFR